MPALGIDRKDRAQDRGIDHPAEPLLVARWHGRHR